MNLVEILGLIIWGGQGRYRTVEMKNKLNLMSEKLRGTAPPHFPGLELPLNAISCYIIYFIVFLEQQGPSAYLSYDTLKSFLDQN
jgi:hypothetical protein